MKTPCKECPFRRKSMKGWLGDSTPEQFMATTMADVHMPCHKTLDYSDPQWAEKWVEGEAGEGCAGAHIFFANICKRSRDRSRPILPKDKKSVFSLPQEFIDHHNSGEFKSWKETAHE